MRKLNLKSFAILMIAFTMTLSFVACDNNNDSTPQAPKVTAPDNQEVVQDASMEVTFSYTAPGGFKSSNVNATNGTATITTDGTTGAKDGNIVVSYTADANTGAASIKLSVTDNNDRTDDATAVVDVVDEITTIHVSEDVSEDMTWETGKTYILDTRINVVNGATLTIQKGVVVKGGAGTGANATALLVTRGSKIMAEGTADQPIIMTTVADNIVPGQIESPNMDPTLSGFWGGLIILGKAPVSVSDNSGEANIEGIDPSDPRGLYGGGSNPDPNDNSGVLKYISIRHGGVNIGEGNEINGLTLGGVGSGTTIENIEVVANQDDGCEFFGGTVNITNFLVWNNGDDAIDTDQNWSGTLDGFFVVNPGDEAMELDGPEGEATGVRHTIKNGIVYAGDSEGLIDMDANGDSKDSNADVMNVYFFGLKDDGSQDFDEISAISSANNLEVTLPAGVTIADIFPATVVPNVTEVAEGANTVGPDVSAFGWTWAAKSPNGLPAIGF